MPNGSSTSGHYSNCLYLSLLAATPTPKAEHIVRESGCQSDGTRFDATEPVAYCGAFSSWSFDRLSPTVARCCLCSILQTDYAVEQLAITHSEWVRLAREVIINTLFEKSGLQLKLTLSRQGDQVST